MNKKEEIKSLANSIMFDLNDEECSKIEDEFDVIINQLSLIDKMNVDSLEPTNFINEKILIDEFENDEVIEYNEKEVFKNSKNFINNFVVIKNEK